MQIPIVSGIFADTSPDLRTREDITQAARDCFTVLLAVMDEIEESTNA